MDPDAVDIVFRLYVRSLRVLPVRLPNRQGKSASLRVDTHDLHPNVVPHLDRVRRLRDPVGGQLGDMDQSF